MSWLSRLAGCQVRLSAAHVQRRAALSQAVAVDARALNQQRWVVLDLETSGLDLRRDQLLSIGAVVIEQGAIDLAQQFECTLHRADHRVSSSVLIHGIAPSEIANGVEPAQALLAFMEFLRGSPVLAFHAAFDRHMLGRALKETLGLRLQHHFYDVAQWAPALCPQANIANGGLDDWTEYFGLQVHQRHHASADALVTAELALILFSKARQQQLDSLPALAQRLARLRRQHAHGL